MSSVSSINNSSISSATTSQTGSSELDREAFMTLLVTQFQYQDPLNPMEDKEFIAQLAQFSSLEQMMNMNESMQGLTDATKSQEMINSTAFIGKNVDVSGTTINKTIDGEGNAVIGTMNYVLGEAALSGRIRITDMNGIEVHSETLTARSAGQHTYTWDGKMANGTDAPEGNYVLHPEFYNDQGNGIAFSPTVDGLVTGVATDSGITYLTLADGRVAPLTQISRVSQLTSANVVPGDDKEDTTNTTENTTTTNTDTENNTSTENNTNTETSTESETGTNP